MNEDGFYGTLFGGVGERVIFIKGGDTGLCRDGRALRYIWGFPGPDSNVYDIEDYGVTWALSKEELDE